tara:strand:+ start:356 stop:652 length:297 start_codon:yes stop_codon:yes gene_type:complete
VARYFVSPVAIKSPSKKQAKTCPNNANAKYGLNERITRETSFEVVNIFGIYIGTITLDASIIPKTNAILHIVEIKDHVSFVNFCSLVDKYDGNKLRTV